MATARVERLVNLVLCLLSTRQYLTAERIRATVPGYEAAPSDEAFFRTFERDKAELRDLGVPLETGRNSIIDQADGYRIARRDYELGEIDLDPVEAAAVSLAVRLWDAPEFTAAARGAVQKLRAAGVDVDEERLATVEPRVRVEPAVAPLVSAVQQGAVVTFDYRRPGDVRTARRQLEPWGVVSWRGRWYVVGHDQDRRATRCFRLSRVFGDVVMTGTFGQAHRPEDVDLLRVVAGADRDPAVSTLVRVWTAADRAHGVRRHGVLAEQRTIGGAPGDVLRLELALSEAVVSWLAGYGPDVLVLEPEELSEAVYEVHLAAAEER